MSGNEIRQAYLNFFQKQQHAIIGAASMIPENDPSLLFVNSGMFPLVPYLLGEKHPEGKRVCDSQPSFRTDDIEEVGDSRHNTFFEMLGNWSFGDYFKEEQLNWWYEFLVEVLGLDIHRLYQSVYGGSTAAPKDDVTIEILKKIFNKYGIAAEEGPETTGKGALGSQKPIEFGGAQRIFSYIDKNWWQRGDAVGEPGGPDSETFYDTGKPHDTKYGQYCHVNCDCGRFIEIGNSVFMQYRKTATGWEELANKNIDFGGGLERITMAVQGKNNIFQTDLFTNLIEVVEKLSGKNYASDQRSFEIITDHIRAAVFLIADGALPSNVAQGYFVRRLIRRAIRYGAVLGVRGHFLSQIAERVIHMFSEHYPQLSAHMSTIVQALDDEEEKFHATLEKGIEMVKKMIPVGTISGRDAFILFTTYGFPIEMTEEIAREHGMTIDRATFDVEMKKHRELSRTASAGMFKGGLVDDSVETTKLHTATHLLNQALHRILGQHVKQKGSNINKDRLRFDFSHPEKLTDAQLKAIEDMVNEQIRLALPVHFEEMSLEEAKKKGAIGVFDSKYGEKVKVYFMGDFSKEICGGPHVNNLSELGTFTIVKEESCGAGVRRIKARVQ